MIINIIERAGSNVYLWVFSCRKIYEQIHKFLRIPRIPSEFHKFNDLNEHLKKDLRGALSIDNYKNFAPRTFRFSFLCI